MKTTCEVCGAEFEIKASWAGKRGFACGRACQAKRQSQTMRGANNSNYRGYVAIRRPCACGCGETTSGGRGRLGAAINVPARFLPGHYARVQPRRSLADRFWKRVNKTETCWLWTGMKASEGYGKIFRNGKPMMAHRASWEMEHGPILDGLCVLHRCDNPPCVNPDHLFLGTQADNVADRDAKGRQARGHRHARAILSEEIVRELRQIVATGVTPYRVAKERGLNPNTVSSAVSGQTWSHVE